MNTTSKSFNSTATTHIPSFNDSKRARYLYNTLSGPYDWEVSSKLEPSKLLHENEILRKRNFELELMVNRKLNELPDEIAILQSENNHLKSLGHARLAEIEEWKRLLNQAKVENKRKFEKLRGDFERRFLEEVEKGVAVKLKQYEDKILALRNYIAELKGDANYLNQELTKVTEREGILLGKSELQFENALERALREELTNQEDIFKDREAKLKIDNRNLIMRVEDLEGELGRLNKILRKKEIEMEDVLEDQKEHFRNQMRNELRSEFNTMKEMTDIDKDQYAQRIRELELENEDLLRELRDLKDTHLREKRDMEEDFVRRQESMRSKKEVKV